jgi:hypothetical protein
VSPVRYELGFYIPEDIPHSHRRETLKSYIEYTPFVSMEARMRGNVGFLATGMDVTIFCCRHRLIHKADLVLVQCLSLSD